MIDILAVGLFVITSVLFLVLGIRSLRKERKRRSCTAMTKGKVIRYNFRNPPTPVVQYVINGVVYKRSFEYTVVVTKSGPGKPVKANFEDVDDTVLRTGKNSYASYTSLIDSFPIGSEMDVYYRPDNPKLSYVHRYARSIVSDIFIAMGIMFFLLSLVIFILAFVNETVGVTLLLVSMIVGVPVAILFPLLRGTRKKNKK